MESRHMDSKPDVCVCVCVCEWEQRYSVFVQTSMDLRELIPSKKEIDTDAKLLRAILFPKHRNM